MNNYSTKELFCTECGNTQDSPLCCTKEMELDKYTFFVNYAVKKKKFPNAVDHI